MKKYLIFLLLFCAVLFLSYLFIYQKGHADDLAASRPLDKFRIGKSSNIMHRDNFGIASGKMSLGIQHDDLTALDGIWAPPYVSSDFSVRTTFDEDRASVSDWVWKPFNVERTATINKEISAQSRTLLMPDKRTGMMVLTLTNHASHTLPLQIAIRVSGTLDYLNTDNAWGFGEAKSSTPANRNSTFIVDKHVRHFFTSTDQLFGAVEDTVYWRNGNQIRRGFIKHDTAVIDPSFLFDGFEDSDRLFDASTGNTLYWQHENQVRRGKIFEGQLSIDKSFSFDGFSALDRLFAASGNLVYWQYENQVRRGKIDNGTLSIDSTFSFDGFTKGERVLTALDKMVYWQQGNQVKRGNILNGDLLVDHSFSIQDVMKEDHIVAGGNSVYWQDGDDLKYCQANNSFLKLEQGEHSVVVSVKNLAWDPVRQAFTNTLYIPGGNNKKIYIVFSVGPTGEALTECINVINDPESAIEGAANNMDEKVQELYQRMPEFDSDNLHLKRFYDRSLIPLLQNKWSVPEFKLSPYYSTGAIKGKCMAAYLWNFGEAMQVMSMYDPIATKAHIVQFLTTGVQRGFGFMPIQGSMLEPSHFYPVNQEKIIGLTYHYVKNTGDVGFLNEPLGSGTVLDAIVGEALFNDDLSQPLKLIDYNQCDPRRKGGNSHLELFSKGNIYGYIMPDLNGRRYLNYQYAAALSALTGKTRKDLLQRADSLKTIVKTDLWDAGVNWFNFVDTRTDARNNRYTVQMFYLLNSGVLDREQEDGLLSHLNENEFLSEWGLHSLSKGDLAYDLKDVDNGGPGSCTAFPLNIAQKLYLSGHPDRAEDILKRILWWGEKMPYWGDSFYADRMDYRKETPLQSTIDGVCAAQCIIFGMFGIAPDFDGSVRINPAPPSFAREVSLKGVKLRNQVFDVRVNGETYEVTCGGKALKANIGQSVVVRNNNPVLADNFD